MPKVRVIPFVTSLFLIELYSKKSDESPGIRYEKKILDGTLMIIYGNKPPASKEMAINSSLLAFCVKPSIPPR